MKDHEIRELVSRVTAIARSHAGCGSLREAISYEIKATLGIVPTLQELEPHPKKLKLFTCNDFKGHYPVGTAAIALATCKEEAVYLLEKQLAKEGLPQKLDADWVLEAFASEPMADILCDGNY